MTESIIITTNQLMGLQNLVKNPVVLLVNLTDKIKDIITKTILNLCIDTNLVFSPEFIGSLYLQNGYSVLDAKTKLMNVDKRGLNKFWFDISSLSSYCPICVQVELSDKKFIFLENELCLSVIKQIKKHIELNKIVKYKQADGNIITLTDPENINQKIEICRFEKNIFAKDKKNMLIHDQPVKKRFLADACFMDIDSPVQDINLKKKKKSISSSKKTDVWNSYVGEAIGKTLCKCCNRKEISSRNFHVGHILAEANGGNLDISNLRPICASCNLSMGTENMIDFMKRNNYGCL